MLSNYVLLKKYLPLIFREQEGKNYLVVCISGRINIPKVFSHSFRRTDILHVCAIDRCVRVYFIVVVVVIVVIVVVVNTQWYYYSG